MDALKRYCKFELFKRLPVQCHVCCINTYSIICSLETIYVSGTTIFAINLLACSRVEGNQLCWMTICLGQGTGSRSLAGLEILLHSIESEALVVISPQGL